jgi:hypothetical protein
MLLRNQPLTANDLRQCLRVATGATLGFVICKLMNWNYGVFYVVTPMLLLGLVPTIMRMRRGSCSPLARSVALR